MKKPTDGGALRGRYGSKSCCLFDSVSSEALSGADATKSVGSEFASDLLKPRSVSGSNHGESELGNSRI